MLSSNSRPTMTRPTPQPTWWTVTSSLAVVMTNRGRTALTPRSAVTHSEMDLVTVKPAVAPASTAPQNTLLACGIVTPEPTTDMGPTSTLAHGPKRTTSCGANSQQPFSMMEIKLPLIPRPDFSKVV